MRAEELLDIKERIEEGQTKVDQFKGQYTAKLNELKEMSFTLKEAAKEVEDLQKEMEKLDDALEKGMKEFNKTFPELGD